MKTIEVVAAVILKDERVFAAQRNAKGEVGLKWEFPGGKIEPGETPEVALKRELREELSIEAEIGDFFMTVHHTYASFNLIMHCYLTSIISGKIILKDHVDSRWLNKQELLSVDWAPADLPVVQEIMDWKGKI